ncbi:MAG: DEAD/DEAH box helicase [Gammaproteobacteria bacterium]|nr:DEAD/DEAH box helicase [Gammaproteobacteria bacterium]
MPQPATSTIDPLAGFEPGLRRWFEATFDGPTDVQRLAWPVIAAGEHVLVTAPTGSGKTLTAFFWALNQYAAGRWQTGATRVLYVSPLKALNNDIQRNLLTPLAGLRELGALQDLPQRKNPPGDTPRVERQRMLRRPPEILITTPESLMLLLTSSRGRHALSQVATVITDEVHALVDNRRGTLLFTALERLAAIAGDFQRIALSATVRPLEAVAAHVAGREADGTARPMRVLDAGSGKDISLRIRFPEAARDATAAGTKIWEALAETFRGIIAANRATLFFVNSRRLAERLTYAINTGLAEPLAYAHHGSLAREIRLEVEQRLKRGELKAIVATSSLEMGIDIGELDEVVLIQAPPAIAAALQRIGRAGHRVGETSRGTLFPTFAQDFVEAAALAGAVEHRDIEPLTPLHNPLDVLCQIVVSMSASETWPVDELYALLRRSGPYHTLARAQFDLVIEMLAGRYEGSRVRELKARLSYDRIRQTVQARHSAVLALYNAGGVIPDRGYFQIRHADSAAVIGELDEEFVWEATTGQVFSLGTQNWQIHHITHNDVLVRPTDRPSSAPPFWRAESQSRSFHYSRHIGTFLQAAEAALAGADPTALQRELTKRRSFDVVAAGELVGYLQRQRDATGTALPHAGHLLAERVLSAPGGYRSSDGLEHLVLHTFWGGRVNRPWALALGAALRQAGIEADVRADDNALAIQSREPLQAEQILGLVSEANLAALLRQSLEGSGIFGARFREAAGRALLLSRQRFNARLPLWLSRLQAKKLLGSVRSFSDFPVLLETWRSCLNDEFDLEALKTCLAALEDGDIAVSACTSQSPSPFAANLTFDLISPHMYATDRPEHREASALSDELIASAVYNAELRPRISAEAVADFQAKRQRTAPGYAPETDDDWAEWIKERILLPAQEAPAELDHGDVVAVHKAGRHWFAHRELLHALCASGLLDGADWTADTVQVADPRGAEQLALEMLSFYGPLTAADIHGLLPAVPDALLDDDETLVRGPLLEDDDSIRYCDPDNFAALLRLQRARRRPRLEPRPVLDLPACVAAWQDFAAEPGRPDDDHSAALESCLEPLRGLDAPVALWLYDLPAARLPGYQPAQLDQAVSELGMHWMGSGKGRIRLGYAEDLALLDDADAPAETAGSISALFADPEARYGFLQLAERQTAPLTEFNEQWWDAVWAGRVAADALTPLRQGVARDFRLGSDAVPARSRGRSGRPRLPRYARSAYADPWAGTWYLRPVQDPAGDRLDELEDAKERARLLLDRYGLVCREIANREGGALRWGALFRALRIMELGGEVTAGYFFHGLSGPQFAPPSALTVLQSERPRPGVFWCNALDPVSPCGLGLDWPELPQRRIGNYLAFSDGALALVAENLGKRLTFYLPPDHPDCATTAALLGFLLARQRRLVIDSVNGERLPDSDYRPVLETVGRLVSDHRASYLESQ